MSSSDGGPAFPQPIAGDGGGMYTSAEKHPDNGGMTLRDFFAAHALAGMLGSQPFDGRHTKDAAGALAAIHNLATGAYIFADAMLKARTESEAPREQQ